MVSPLSLYVLAAALLLLAAASARLGRCTLGDALADGGAALLGTSVVVVVAVAVLSLSQPLAASQAWRDAGALALMASPLGATLALRLRNRRSFPRALAAATCALAGVVLWLTLNLRGPRGGWTLVDLALVLLPACTAVASAACLGWWSKRSRVTADRRHGGPPT